MCGIAGIIDAGAAPVAGLLAKLEALNGAQRHRGPDDAGIWTSADGRAGLAHVRLSILDLSPAGHQPMHSADGNFHIVFNGEIFNFREIRQRLEQEGFRFSTGTDTEVLLRLYEKEGPEMLGSLRGMFAFAIWDQHRGRCFLARDPLGIKPLYYAQHGRRLAFASEMRSLHWAGCSSGSMDPVALAGYFKTGSVAEPDTLLADVKCLEAGHCLVWEEGRLAARCYWRPQFAARVFSPEEAVEEVRSALQDSVRAHFVSDVPVGMFLSGGIDSTALVALARQAGQNELATFSIGVDDANLDESSIARRTAQHFGTRHQELRLDAGLALRQFQAFLQAMDQPSIDGFNTFNVASFARECGMKVVLSGLGGDEMFGGYKSFRSLPGLSAMARAARLAGSFAAGAGRIVERHASSPRLRRVGSLLQTQGSMHDAHTCFRGIFSTREARMLAASYLDCAWQDIPPETPPQVEAEEPLDSVSECELRFYMRNQLLKDSDVMSMAHGLELRVPLVDRVFFERVSCIPAAMRLRQGKKMLLEAVPEIPEWVSGAPKRGFSFPFEKWLGQEWGGSFSAATARTPYKNPTWYQRWAVFMMDTWQSRAALTRA